MKITDKFISLIPFSSKDIARIIRDVDPNKAHGNDMICIRMLKICGDSISIHLGIMFKSCIESQFANESKIANVNPIHKKGDKQVPRNYRPVSLLPICGKYLNKIIFELLMFNNLFEFFIKNDLILSNQLLSIRHEIYQSFDNGL